MEIQKDFIQCLRGRAEFCRDRGEVKTPELLEQAAQLLEEKAQAVPEGYKVVPVNYECVWCGCTELDGWADETMIEAQEQK